MAKINFVFLVAADTGTIGGHFSHEYHFVAEKGEDNLLICKSCSKGFALNTFEEGKMVHKPCGNAQLEKKKAIEVGHTFLLGTRYSSFFDAKYTSKDGTSKK